MIDKSEILKEFVKEPSSMLQFEDPSFFENLVVRYPFFQSARLLRMLFINYREGFPVNEELTRTAVFFGNRAMLYNYFHKSETSVRDLKSVEDKKTNKSGLEVPSESETDILHPLRKPPKDIMNDIPTPDQQFREKKREETNKLLDKFILAQPSVQRPTTQFYSASNMATKSLQDSEEFVTETLAEIFTRQENFVKAIKIYEKLSLLYPEKSSKFAVLIENLKSKITD